MYFPVPPPEPPAIVKTIRPEVYLTSLCLDAQCKVDQNLASDSMRAELPNLPAPEGKQLNQDLNSQFSSLESSTASPQQVTAVNQTSLAQTQNSPTRSEQPQLDTTGLGKLIEVVADRQEYDEQRQVITAEGNVVLRFQQAVMDADRIQINVPNRLVVAEGNVVLRRGQQVLRGGRFEYDFVQDTGAILNAQGEINLATTQSDLAVLPNDVGSATLPTRPLSDRALANQPLQQVTNPGNYTFIAGSKQPAQNLPAQETGGKVNRLRFQADRVEFDAQGWRATNIRITNDPFSPPELELRADTAQLRRLSPLQDEVTTSRSRIVFDQNVAIPTFQNRVVIDRRQREPPLFSIGYDSTDRGGLFIQRGFDVFSNKQVRFSLTPQFLIQRSITQGGGFDGSAFGLRANIDGNFSPRTLLQGSANFTSLNPDEIENKTRGSLRLRQAIGRERPHTLNLEYSYRDRLFNGSLGFQTVQSSLGAVLTSPVIFLGNSGISLTYQAGAQYINADTDRLDLLPIDRRNNRISLSRYQASASLNKGFLLWQGKPLPSTPTEGLRYSPIPVVPYLTLGAGITGVTTFYSNGDTQDSLSGNIGLQGQFGHFSKPTFDYTAFNLNFSQVGRTGASPFLFDRLVDTKVLSGGISQQIYGPLRFGFQTSVNLDINEPISTDYILEYSRRAYNIILRYNPNLEIGSISFRINDFNWVGNPEPFDGYNIRPVVQGVTRE